MAELKIHKSTLAGSIKVPPSKSQTLRAILFGSLAKGRSVIHNYLKSPDTYAMCDAMRSFGAEINVKEEAIEIIGVNGELKPAENIIDAGNSGQVLRFVGALSALLPTYTVITGDHSVRNNRPIQPLLNALGQLGGFAVSSRLDGRAPVIIQGPISKGVATLSGEDSQPVSGLLIAAAFLEGTTEINVLNPGEKPWIDLTLSWLKRFGAKVSHECYEHYTITGPLRYDGFEMTIPGDFSSAAFPLAGALITNSAVSVENIDMEECQGDKKIVDLLIKIGSKIEIEKERLVVNPNGTLKGMTHDVNEIIDAIPILAVLGCFAKGKTVLTNGAIARKKESDRIHAIAVELRKMGADIEEREDGLIITPAPLRGARVSAHADHRIAMALAIAGMGAEGITTIEGGDCIVKSYPLFADDFQRLGGKIE